MAKTYSQLAQEIETLKAHAEAVRQKEKAGVAARIREAIGIYGLTAHELGFGNSPIAAKSGAASSGSKPSVSPNNAKVKYRDDAGHTWSGRGPKPNWLKAGLAAGRSLESFAANQGKAQSATGRSAAAPQPKQTSKKGKKKYKSAVKYRDDAGHQWSGRGPKPGWVTAALQGGKTLEQLAV
jgi:DNA-binding protein H-NS